MNSSSTYSFLIIPDTQNLSKKYHQHWEPMVNWVIANKEKYNIRMALHVGDVVDDGDQDEGQFMLASTQLNRITDANLPLLIVPGNHDYDNLLSEDRGLSMYSRYFGDRFYATQRGFGGFFEQGSSANLYFTQEIEGQTYLFLGLEFGPRPEVIAWANEILEAHHNDRAVIVTHSYLFVDGKRTSEGATHHPRGYKGIDDANDGEELWQKCLQHHQNVFAVFSGHHVPGNVSVSIDKGVKGNRVIQSFQNWQLTAEGGQGRLRLLTINPQTEEGKLQVYNPVTDQFEQEPDYELHFSLK